MTAKKVTGKPENPTEVLKKASDAIIENGIDFTITVAKPNILHRLKILPREKTFNVKPLHYGTLIRMSKIIIQIDKLERVENHIVEGIDYISRYADMMIDIIAIALTDTKIMPSPLLKIFIRNNLTAIEVFELLNIVATQMRIVEFLQSIILIKGMNQMENLMQNKMEKAPQTNNTEISGEQLDQ